MDPSLRGDPEVAFIAFSFPNMGPELGTDDNVG